MPWMCGKMRAGTNVVAAGVWPHEPSVESLSRRRLQPKVRPAKSYRPSREVHSGLGFSPGAPPLAREYFPTRSAFRHSWFESLMKVRRPCPIQACGETPRNRVNKGSSHPGNTDGRRQSPCAKPRKTSSWDRCDHLLQSEESYGEK